MNTQKLMQCFLIVWLLSLLGCGGGGGSGNGVSPPPPPPVARTPEKVVFVASDGISGNGSTELYSIDDDGQNRRTISAETARSDADIQEFAISPDKRWVAYTTDINGHNFDALFVVSIDGGSEPVQVSRVIDKGLNRSVKRFDWSPQSDQLVYEANLDGALDGNTSFFANEIFLVNRDGTGHTKISGSIGRPAQVEVRNPQWSPDGRYIVQEVADFDSGRGARDPHALNIYDTALNSPNSRRLVTVNSIIRKVRWSPDSARVSFMGDAVATGEFRVLVTPVDGSSLTQVTDNGNLNSDARWSPNGATLAYLDHPSQPFPSDLVTSSATPGAGDSVLVFVSPNDRRVTDYQWSPNGRRIAYISNEDIENKDELYVVNADGTGSPTRINGPLNFTSNVFDFAWSPDGSRIAYTADQGTDTFRDLYVSSATGATNTWISSSLNGEEVVEFDWSRDSQRLIFSTGPDGRTPTPDKVYVSLPDGSGRMQLNETMSGGPLAFSY